MSGWQDSNLRPSAPKADALTGLRYTPNCDRKYDRERNLSHLSCTQLGGNVINIHHFVAKAIVTVFFFLGDDHFGHFFRFGFLLEDLIAE